MIAFIDPKTQQVKAVYSHDTESTAWTDQGYVRVEVAEDIAGQVRKLARDARVTLHEGMAVAVEVSPDPEPPEIKVDPKRRRMVELANKASLTPEEVQEGLKLLLGGGR